MTDNLNINVEVQPIIDSQNPPVSVDSVMLGERSAGAIRLVCFADNVYIEREEQRHKDGEETKVLWIRPVSVIDIGANAVKFAEAYLLRRLSEGMSEMQYALENFPEVMDKLYQSLKKVKEEHADD